VRRVRLDDEAFRCSRADRARKIPRTHQDALAEGRNGALRAELIGAFKALIENPVMMVV
jgi:hypothetical protein